MAISSPTQDFVVSSGLNVQGTGTVTSSTGNTSTLQVDGGAAIAKNVIVGGTVEIYGDTTIHGNVPYLSVTGTSTLATVTAGYTTATQLDVTTRLLVGGLSQLNNVTVTNPTNSTATTNGALVVTGGVGVGGNLYAGTIYSNGQQVLTSGTGGGFISSIAVGTDTAISSSTGAVTIWNTSTLQSVTGRGATTTDAVSITNTASSTSTTTGALKVTGGVGIGGNLNVAGNFGIKNTIVSVLTDSVASWAYDSTFSVTNPSEVFFKPDGLRMYVATSTVITQYDLSVAWDITTAVVGLTFVMSLIDTVTNGLFISPDGTKMITCGQTGVVITNGAGVAGEDRAYYFTLGTSWDVSSATLVSSVRFAIGDAGGIPSAMTAPQAVDFNNDGTIMYIQDSTTDAVHQFALSSAYNVGTATWTKQFSVVGQESGGTGLRFNSSGTRMYLYGSAGDDVNEYRLGTAWDVATAVYYNRFYAGWYEATPTGMYINESANVAFLCGSSSDVVLKFFTNKQGLQLIPESATGKIDLNGNTRVTDNFYVGGRTVLEGQVNTVGDLVVGSDLTITGNDLLVGSATAGATLFSGLTSGALSIATSETTGAITVGGTAATGIITVGQSTASQTLNLSAGAIASGTTKTINIGTSGLTGSTSTINIGSTASSALGVITIGGTQTIIVSTTSAISTLTGALQVRGGVGIGGALYVNTTSFINGSQILTTATVNQYANQTTITAGTDTAISTSTGNITIWNTSTLQSVTDKGATTNNAITITNTTSATSTSTGALQVRGGVGIGGAIYAANTSYIRGSRILVATDLETVTTTATYITNNPALVAVSGTSTTYGTYNTGTVASISSASDYASPGGYYSINDAATQPAYIVYIGFTGVTGFSRLVVYINYTVGSTHTIDIDLYNYVTSSWDTFSVYSGTTNYFQFIMQVDDDTKYTSAGVVTARIYHASFGNTAHETRIDYVVLEDSIQGGQGPRGAIGATGATGAQGLTTSTTSTFIFFNTTSATSTSSAAVVAYGGVGIGGGLIVGGAMTITNTSSNTGSVGGNALQVVGGVGIGGGMFVQGQATFASSVVFAGTTTYVLTTNTVYTDNIIELHYTSTWTVNDGKDIGLRFHYYDDQDRNAFFGRDNTTGYLEWVGQAGDDTQNNVTGTNGTFRTGAIVLTSTTASSSTSTGALTVAGGVGVGGDIWAGNIFAGAGQYLYFGGQTGTRIYRDGGLNGMSLQTNNTSRIFIADGSGSVTITTTTNATSTTTGALQVVGGAGIGRDLWVGGAIYANGQQVLTSGTGGGFISSITAGTDTAINTSTGAVTIWDISTLQSVTGRGATTTNAVSITNTASSTSTTTGALKVTGGVGVGGSVYAGALYDNNNRVVTSVIASGTTYIGITNLISTGTATSFTINNLGVTNVTGTTYLAVSASTGSVTFTNLGVQTLTAGTDTAVSSNTGTVIVWNTGTLQSVTNRGSTTTNAISITNTASSTSTTTGALVVTGGVGIGGALYVNTTSFINGSQILTTATINQYASQTTITAGTDTAVNTSTGAVTIWNTGTLQSVTNRGATTTNAISITNTASSTSTTTGALKVTGGVGVGGNLNVGGTTSSFANTVVIGTSTVVTTTGSGYNTGTISSLFVMGAATGFGTPAVATFQRNESGTQTSITSLLGPKFPGVQIIGDSSAAENYPGSLMILTPGAGISSTRGPEIYLISSRASTAQISTGTFSATQNGDQIGRIFFGGDQGTVATTSLRANGAFVAGTASSNWSSTSTEGSITFGTTPFGSTGAVDRVTIGSTGKVSIVAIITATSTTTGALTVTGGVGIGGKLFVGGLANNTSSYIAYYNTTTGELGFGTNPVQQTLVALTTASASFFPTFVDSNNSVATAESFYTTSSFTINPATGNVTIGTTAASLSTSTSTGALQVRGGVGVSDSVYVGNRVGFVGTTQASVVYQFYNTLTNSLDTVFG